MMRNKFLLLCAVTGLVAACNKPAEPAPAPVETQAALPAEEAAPAVPAAPEIPPDRATPAQKAEAEAAAAKAGIARPNQESRGTWTCANGEKIELRFFPADGVAVLVRNGKNMEMQMQPAASGFKYSNGPVSFHGKGEQLDLTTGTDAPVTCKLDS